MTSYHLAQLNIARMKFELDSPELSDFVEKLDEINALADRAPGFIWRLKTDEGDATSIDYFGADTLVNMSVWKDVPSLHAYVYKTAHAKIMSRRKEWFHRVEAAYTVLWWIPPSHLPTLEESNQKLSLIRAKGPSAQAFSFKKAFPPPDENSIGSPREFDDLCPAV